MSQELPTIPGPSPEQVSAAILLAFLFSAALFLLYAWYASQKQA